MKTHLDHLLEIFPHILEVPVLDVGAGRGKFLIDLALRGGDGKGVELKKGNIEIALERAKEIGIQIDLFEAKAEALPFPNGKFGFVNICEVIEHVKDPKKVLEEVHRVLVPGGEVYMSVPNRFGFKDQHFHLYFVNWLPRRWSDKFISLFGKHKNYDGQSGLQRLDEMHYFTYRQIKHLVSAPGFKISDIREQKIKAKILLPFHHLALLLYRFLRIFLFDSFHVKLVKIQ